MSAPARLPDFSKLSVAVVGDLIADHWLYAQPTRLSREAPVMVLRHERDAIGAGGAANVARNLRALGAKVALFGLVGRDANGRELVAMLDAEGIDVDHVETVPGWTTPTKTRVLAAEARRSPHQVLRIDREPREVAPASLRKAVHAAARERVDEFGALLVSDYAYGLVTPETAALAALWRENERVSVLDPRADVDSFRGALTALTPNVSELARFAHVDATRLDDVAELRAAATTLIERLEPTLLLVTRGNAGMALFGRDLPADGVAVAASGDGEVTDVTGAGDTAAAVFALALAAELEPARAMALANAAAGVVVMEQGAAACAPSALVRALASAPAPVHLAGGARGAREPRA